MARRTGYAPVPGSAMALYYEDHGSGEPLVLLHGGLGAGEMYGPLLRAVTAHRRVIVPDLQGHGRTADVPGRPLRPELLADDIAALLRHLDIARADVVGYSLGAMAALRTAVQYPDLVRRLALISIPYRHDGWHPEVLAGYELLSEAAAEPMRESAAYGLYERLAPRPGDWPTLVAKSGELLRRAYDWSPAVRALTSPTLLVYGDSDSIRPAHMVEFYALLGGGLSDPGPTAAPPEPRHRLAVLPSATHYDILSSPSLPPALIPFLYF